MAIKTTPRTGPYAGVTRESPELSIIDAIGHGSATGNKNEEDQLRDLDESNSSQEASNAGRTAQSTDHMNNP